MEALKQTQRQKGAREIVGEDLETMKPTLLLLLLLLQF